MRDKPKFSRLPGKVGDGICGHFERSDGRWLACFIDPSWFNVGEGEGGWIMFVCHEWRSRNYPFAMKHVLFRNYKYKSS